MTKFNSIINAESGTIEFIGAERVKAYKELAGKAMGMVYIRDRKTAILTSNSVLDIYQVIENGCWAHTRNATEVVKGWTIVIVPDAKEQKKYGDAAIGVKFTALESAYKDSNEASTLNWISESNLATA